MVDICRLDAEVPAVAVLETTEVMTPLERRRDALKNVFIFWDEIGWGVIWTQN
jgi:hypothetical protein